MACPECDWKMKKDKWYSKIFYVCEDCWYTEEV